jgi:hypothetical protein
MSFVILNSEGNKVAIQNETCSGVYLLRKPLNLEEEGRLKYIELPRGSKKVGSGREALGYFRDGLYRVTAPTEDDWNKARHWASERYEDNGYYEESWWLGKNLDGEEFPCRKSEFISDY